jgi:2,5-furandicarboxylate decarboxylase 1
VSKDLHSFLEEYEQAFPDEVIHVEQEISSRHEVTALVTHLEKQRKFPILIFHRVMTSAGISPLPLVCFLMSSRKRLADLLGSTVERSGVAAFDRLSRRIDPVVIPKGDAPVKEIIEREDDVNLRAFPAPVHHEMDPGPYITGGFFTAYFPETKIANTALQRGWIRGPREIRVCLESFSHNYMIFQQHEAKGEDTRAAFWIGHHPLAILGCQNRIPTSIDHFSVGGGFLGEPMRLTASESLGEDFLVPADAEIVIEGIIPCGRRRPEAPFGEFTRYYGPQRWNPYMIVTAVTRRRNALWDDVMVGHTHWISSLVREGHVFQKVKEVVPTVVNVHVPMSGCGVRHVYIQIRKTSMDQGKLALAAALNSHPSIKHAFLVDEDVDIFDEKEVLMALANRFLGDKDLLVLEDRPTDTLDPIITGTTAAKVGFDCTKPVGRPFPKQLGIPEEVRQRVRPEEFLDLAKLARTSTEPYG